MSARKPKDLHIAEIAYNAFYEEQPQVFFDDLAHGYQMRWVSVIRSVLGEYKRIPKGGTTGPRPKADGAKKAFSGMSVADLKMINEQDMQAHFTDKPWKKKSKEEVKARQRVNKRQQRIRELSPA